MLRELLQHVRERVKGLSPSHYALLKALVEAVEAQENDDLRKERDGWERGCSEAERELAKAKADSDAWMRRCEGLERLLAVQKASIADAKLGKMVRGMDNDTGLGWEDGLYYALRCYYYEVGRLAWYRPESGAYHTDPTKVLQTIQREKEE